MNIVQEIKKTIATGLVVRIRNIRKLSGNMQDDKIRIGDTIEVDFSIRNGNPFMLENLQVNLINFQAVSFETSPVIVHLEKLLPEEERDLTTVKGFVKENPNDQKSIWQTMDKLCKVTIKGELQLPRIHFYDEELKMIDVRE